MHIQTIKPNDAQFAITKKRASFASFPSLSMKESRVDCNALTTIPYRYHQQKSANKEENKKKT